MINTQPWNYFWNFYYYKHKTCTYTVWWWFKLFKKDNYPQGNSTMLLKLHLRKKNCQIVSCSRIYEFRRLAAPPRKVTLWKIFLSPFLSGSTHIGKNLSLRSNSFPLRVDPNTNGASTVAWCSGKQSWPCNLSAFVELAENLPGVSFPLK